MTPKNKECHTSLVVYTVGVLLVIFLMAFPISYLTKRTVVSTPLFVVGQTIKIPGSELTGTITYTRKRDNNDVEYEVRYFIDNCYRYVWIQDVELRK